MKTDPTIGEAPQNAQAATCLILCERWLKKYPNDVQILFDYASMLYQLTRYDDAIDVYQHAISLADDELSCEFNQLGHLYHYRGDLHAAVHWYELAINEDPECGRSRTFLSQSLAQLGRLEEAEHVIRAANECEYIAEGESYSHLGKLLRAQGKFDEAAAAFRTALKSWEDDAELLTMLRDVETAAHVAEVPTDVSAESIRDAFADRPATGIAMAERYLVEEAGDCRTLLMYATMLTDVWRYDDAERVCEFLLEQDRSLDRAYQGLGALNRKRGELLLAAGWYEKAAEEDPDNAANHILRGGALARSGDLVAAEECHRRATKCIRGDIDEAYLNLGMVLRGQDRLAEAAECFRTALDICENYESASVALKDVETAMSLLAETRSNS